MQITTVGLDIAKNLFQVHGVDAQGRVLLKRKLARGKVLGFFATLPACLVGLEACGAAHYWARELARLGHQVRLMPPQYVRPYVKTIRSRRTDWPSDHNAPPTSPMFGADIFASRRDHRGHHAKISLDRFAEKDR